MSAKKPTVYVFGWPSFLGGADTKLAHLLELLHRHVDVTCIPNDEYHLRNKVWTRYMDKLGVKYCLRAQLPRKLEGWAFAMCNERFFTDGIIQQARERGLKVIWSNEMMWHHPGELAAVGQGLVDKVLYVSELQKKYLGDRYGNLPWLMTGNYINPKYFPFRYRQNTSFAIGRLSRADAVKFPEDFPVFYESLDLPDTRFRVMAWDDALTNKYKWHHFDSRWDLLPAEKESQLDFLHSLDLFVYPLGHTFKESWGRSTVEAMLTGCIPLVPAGHHLDHLIVHGESGFICQDFTDYKDHARRLCLDFKYRLRLSKQARQHAEGKICNRAEHLNTWLQVFA